MVWLCHSSPLSVRCIASVMVPPTARSISLVHDVICFQFILLCLILDSSLLHLVMCPHIFSFFFLSLVLFSSIFAPSFSSTHRSSSSLSMTLLTAYSTTSTKHLPDILCHHPCHTCREHLSWSWDTENILLPPGLLHLEWRVCDQSFSCLLPWCLFSWYSMVALFLRCWLLFSWDAPCKYLHNSVVSSANCRFEIFWPHS